MTAITRTLLQTMIYQIMVSETHLASAHTILAYPRPAATARPPLTEPFPEVHLLLHYVAPFLFI